MPMTPPPGPKIEVPVRSVGSSIYDREGRIILMCVGPDGLAERIAFIINRDAEADWQLQFVETYGRG